MLEVLSNKQIEFYNEQGYLLLEKRIPDLILDEVRDEISRFKALAYGMQASDERIDLEDSHTPENPRIRRVKLPHTQSTVFDELMRSDHILAPVRDLIGPDIRLQTSKLNMKSAGYGAAVEWHQDWGFYPYTNDDVLAVGVIVDDMASSNGPLMVFPGSHKGPVYNHHHNGCFVGAIDIEAEGLDPAGAVALNGPAGSISIHHARTVHGSALNKSAKDRRVIFFEMMAADAFPVAGSRGKWAGIEEFDQRMLCGVSTMEPRVTSCPVRIAFPEPPTEGSIYEIQRNMGKRWFDVAE